jgi:hypothetical protein
MVTSLSGANRPRRKCAALASPDGGTQALLNGGCEVKDVRRLRVVSLK